MSVIKFNEDGLTIINKYDDLMLAVDNRIFDINKELNELRLLNRKKHIQKMRKRGRKK